jgi:CTD nuclear envelope phosphatase 1
MNSLTYLSRQFDVLAQPRTPPSTPTSETTSFLSEYPQPSRSPARRNSGSDSTLKRVKTWSTRSFLLPPSSHYNPTPSQPRRSFSSPADFVAITSMRSSISSSLDAGISPSEHLESAARRLFFIRVFLLLWNAMRDVWSSLTRREVVGGRHSILVDDATDTDDKESGDEKLISLRESEPLLKPPNPAYVPQPSTHTPALVPFLVRSDTEPSLPSEAKQGAQFLSATASLIACQVGQSRSSTPSLTARKTPFHLPKTLVLDLDETLIHSTSRPMYSSGTSSSFLGLGTLGRRNKGAGHMVEVVLGGRSTLYHVYKRPFVDFFLRTVSYHILLE